MSALGRANGKNAAANTASMAGQRGSLNRRSAARSVLELVNARGNYHGVAELSSIPLGAGGILIELEILSIILGVLLIPAHRLIPPEHLLKKSMLLMRTVFPTRPRGHMVRVHTGTFCNLGLSEALLGAKAAHKYGCVHECT